MGFKVTVDKERCTGCEECLEACTVGVFEIRNGRSSSVRPKKCLGCRSCVEVCEQDAISVEEIGIEMSEQCLSLLGDIL